MGCPRTDSAPTIQGSVTRDFWADCGLTCRYRERYESPVTVMVHAHTQSSRCARSCLRASCRCWQCQRMDKAMSDDTKSNAAKAAPASRWAGFQPPPLPEADKLRSAVEAARKLTPREVMKVSINAGIHNADGTLTSKYR